MTPVENISQIACYIPIEPLDISSEWTCTICHHTVGHTKIGELEEIAVKIISAGKYNFMKKDFPVFQKNYIYSKI